jgi:hypothetical protein
MATAADFSFARDARQRVRGRTTWLPAYDRRLAVFLASDRPSHCLGALRSPRTHLRRLRAGATSLLLLQRNPPRLRDVRRHRSTPYPGSQIPAQNDFSARERLPGSRWRSALSNSDGSFALR